MSPEGGSGVLAWGPIIIGVIGGLALFLFGMEQMTEALKSVAGRGMKKLLARMTTNRFKAAVTGAFITGVIQSSTVTTVLVVGFISAGLMSLSQSIGIIMGANIGSTFTAQILAFKVTQYGLVMIAVGFSLRTLLKQEWIRSAGTIILGLGLVFFGMDHMSSGTQPLRTYEPFIDVVAHMDNIYLGIIVGAVFTAILHSSAAMTGIVIVLAGEGIMPLESGIAVVLGANIGTCVTALLAAIGKPREAVQAAVVHVLFNIIGVVLWLAFIPQLADLVRILSPSHAELEGAARLAAETPRQIANAHTVFNVANTMIFIWFTQPLANLVQRLVPYKPTAVEEVARPRYLEEVYLSTPDLALDRVNLELVHLAEVVDNVVRTAPKLVMHGNRSELLEAVKMDDAVDSLQKDILNYLGRVAQGNISETQSSQVHCAIEVANYLENIGDMAATNLIPLGLDRVERELEISESMAEVLEPLFDKVCWSVKRVRDALDGDGEAAAAEVIRAKSEINGLADAAEGTLAKRLAGRDEDRMKLFRMEADLIENMKRIYYFAKRIAKTLTDEEEVM